MTRRSDVYTFRIVLIELISGRKTLEVVWVKKCVPWFHGFVGFWTTWKTSHKVSDESLNLDNATMGSICKVVELACHCTAPEPNKRHDMRHVVNVLVPLVE